MAVVLPPGEGEEARRAVRPPRGQAAELPGLPFLRRDLARSAVAMAVMGGALIVAVVVL